MKVKKKREDHILAHKEKTQGLVLKRRRLFCGIIHKMLRICFLCRIIPVKNTSEQREHKDLEDRNLLQNKSLKLENITNEKMSKRRIQIKESTKKWFTGGR